MLSALAFLTVVGGAHAPDERTLRWFPVLGAALGGAMALVWWAATALWPPLLAAAVVVFADLVFTGMLHFDGLADSADGFLPHLDRDRRLEVMSQPDVGAFALTIVPNILALRWGAIATGTVGPLGFVGIWALSRTLIAAAPSFLPYARDRGLASPFITGSRRSLLGWAAPIVGVLAVAHGLNGVGAAVGAGLVCVALGALARRRLGGFTGDVLGAMVVLGETVALLILVIGPAS